jgi:hypothetical protein
MPGVQRSKAIIRIPKLQHQEKFVGRQGEALCGLLAYPKQGCIERRKAMDSFNLAQRRRRLCNATGSPSGLR